MQLVQLCHAGGWDKTKYSRIIKSIHVKQGDKVTAGQLIATINVVPSISEMNAAQQSIKDAELQIGNAKITLNNQQKQYDMQKGFLHKV